jgi:endonuclease/exonuclease/phosphatase family metal-dependent hydrolase
VRVLTLNVNGLPWTSHLAPLADRSVQFGRLIEDSDIDVACFQEVWTRGALAAVRRGLPSFPHIAVRTRFGHPAGGLAMLSRRPLGRARYVSFRGLVPAAGTLGFRARRAVNSAQQGVLVVPAGGLVVATTHLTANHDGDWSATNRHFSFQRAQLARLSQVVGTGVQVLAGDFNIASDGPLYPDLSAGWQDPFAGTDPVTFHLALLPAGSRGHRIDYLLVRDVPVAEAATVFDTPLPSGLYLSDHIGLSARIGPPPV